MNKSNQMNQPYSIEIIEPNYDTIYVRTYTNSKSTLHITFKYNHTNYIDESPTLSQAKLLQSLACYLLEYHNQL